MKKISNESLKFDNLIDLTTNSILKIILYLIWTKMITRVI